jgi:hypothetical protein
MLQQKQLNLVVGFYNNFNRISIKFPTDYQKIYKTIKMLKLNSINEMNIDSVDTSIPEKVVYVIRLWHTFNRLAVIPYLQILGTLFERINKIPNGPDMFEAFLENDSDIINAAVKTTSRGCLLIPNVNKDNIEENIMYQKFKFDVNEFVFTKKGALYCPENTSIINAKKDIKDAILNETGPDSVFVWNKLLNNKVSTLEPGLIITFKKDKEYIFYRWNGEKVGERLFSIKRYTLLQWEEAAPADYAVLQKDSVSIWAAAVEEDNPLAITFTQIQNNFRFYIAKS